MKIISPMQMTDLEALAYQNGASESDFMEEAGSGIALVVQDYVERYGLDRAVLLLCGKGNNGGDAYVAGIYLLHLDYEVFAIQPDSIDTSTPLSRLSYQRFIQEGGRLIEKFEKFPLENGIIIDGLFGTGFKGSIKEPYESLIKAANQSGFPIISVDIPSGLNGETGLVEGNAIIATKTAFLELPKQGFFY